MDNSAVEATYDLPPEKHNLGKDDVDQKCDQKAEATGEAFPVL